MASCPSPSPEVGDAAGNISTNGAARGTDTPSPTGDPLSSLSRSDSLAEERPSPSLRRKPVPTPRNTLKKRQPLTVAQLGRRASDLDSQVSFLHSSVFKVGM